MIAAKLNEYEPDRILHTRPESIEGRRLVTSLPIVSRELRVASRRRGTYLTRTAAAIMAILGSAWILLGLAEELNSVQMGQALFVMLTSLVFLFCLGAGLRTTSDCISEEKREGTLGLLFLTDLRGYDVILGKLASNSLSTFYAILAIFPVLALPILLGGVSLGQFWRVVLSLLVTLLLSMSLGILLSTYGWEGRRSAALGTLLLLLLNAAPPSFAVYFSIIGGSTGPDGDWMVLSPAFASAAAFDVFYLRWNQQFWTSIALQIGMASAALLWASLAIPRLWQDRPATVRTQTLREKWKLWKLGHSAERRNFRSRLLDVNPILWLASRDRLRPALVWGYLGIVACVWVWAALKVGEDWFDPVTYDFTGLLLLISLKAWIAVEAARRFTDERAAGSLELLLSTPLTTAELLHGMYLSMRRQFLGPMLAVLGLCVLMLFVSIQLHPSVSERGKVIQTVLYLLLCVLDAHALCWTGFWQGMSTRKPRRAGMNTMFLVLAIPWLAFLGASMIVGMLIVVSPWLRTSSEMLAFWGWPVLGLGNSLIWIYASKSSLRNKLRSISVPAGTRHATSSESDESDSKMDTSKAQRDKPPVLSR